ncbi:MAG TPA: oligosaccharide flippase family protein, partial [Clostridia bacterium]|nr:oligosaccharide flippase family protein [Clostridia bacterium]
SLVCVAGMMVLTSFWYSRKVKIEPAVMTVPEIRREVASLLKLGFAFMASALLTMGAAYVIRIIVIKQWGLEAAGLYQSAWALGGVYVGFILQAMGADFYPRLTASASNNAECNRLVNEQAQISLLLAGPGVIGTLTFAPLVIHLLYSSKFGGAVEILRWICLGMTLRVIAWPMGFIVLAKGWRQIFFWTELAATIVHVGLAWVFVVNLGPKGAGMGFFGLYVWHGLLIYVIIRRLCGFRWSTANKQLGRIFLPLIGIVFAGFYVLPFWPATAIGTVAALLSGLYSVRVLLKLVELHRIPRPILQLLVRLRLAPPGAV